MRVRIHTYRVQRVTYEVDVENEAGAEERLFAAANKAAPPLL